MNTSFDDIFEMRSHVWQAVNGKPVKKRQVTMSGVAIDTGNKDKYRKGEHTITSIRARGKTLEVTYQQRGKEYTWTVPNTAEATEFVAEVFQTFLEEHAELEGDRYVLLPGVSLSVELVKRQRGKFDSEWVWARVTEL